MDSLLNRSQLSFEFDVDGDSPRELWRVTAWRTWGNRKHRTTEWHASEAFARERAAHMAETGDEVIAVTKYVQEPTDAN
jgi:hypothetical protein